jgi:two-component system cell cycle response regulator
VITADTGEEGRDLLEKEEPFDLLVASVSIKGLDGLALLDLTLANSPSTPVILLADASSVDRALEGLQKGAYDHIVVPCEKRELQATVRRGLEKRHLVEELKLRADTDPLTGLANRAIFERRLEDEFYKSLRYGNPLSLLFVDIDEFKSVNDEHGHQVGDLYLKVISELMVDNVRSIDLVARYGGEEIVVLLPQTTSSAANQLAERLRELVGNFVMRHGDLSIKRTISIGIASYPGVSVKEPGDFIQIADAAMYAAKQAGRNRIVSGHNLPLE